MTTFQQFIDSRVGDDISDLRANDFEYDDGFRYLDSFYIIEHEFPNPEHGMTEVEYIVEIGREEHTFAKLDLAEKFLWEEFAMLECNNDLRPVRFYFGDDPTYDGFADGSTWNGFDNVMVTPKVHKEIKNYFLNVCKYDPEEMHLPAEPNALGLYDYSNGFATSIDDEEEQQHEQQLQHAAAHAADEEDRA